MRSLWTHWSALAARLRAAPRRLLVFDYDGTLSPLVDRPAEAILPESTKALLRTLSRQPQNTVSLLSGRSIRQLKRFVRLPGILYGGNHGLELEEAGRRWVHPEMRRRTADIQRAARILRKALEPIAGARLENKTLSLSVHFREVPPSKRPELRRTLRRSLRPLRRRLDLRAGEKIIEVRPRIAWNKGAALRRLARRMPRGSVLLFAGDDQTDEDAFRAIRRRGISVRVGRARSSRAAYYLRRQAEMSALLKKLAAL